MMMVRAGRKKESNILQATSYKLETKKFIISDRQATISQALPDKLHQRGR